MNDLKCNHLLQPISCIEVHKAIFSIKDEKSLGPDGISSKFYKLKWALIKDELTQTTNSVYFSTDIPEGLNHAFLTLIPKKDNPSDISDYRPIGCCNVLYKLISKVICNRIKGFLPLLISESQCAYVLRRNITDNIISTWIC